LKEDRQVIQMAAASATLEEAAAILRTSVETIERKAERLGIKLKGKRPPPPSRARAEGEAKISIATFLRGVDLIVIGTTFQNRALF
jgi:nucleotide-binding universal stress UspA family protein